MEMVKTNLDDIPLCYVRPDKIEGIALWIPYLGGTCGSCADTLRNLGERGFLAISLDPWGHGDRAWGRKPSVRTDALKRFRLIMWQILGLTVLDCSRIIDWAREELDGTGPVVAGGLSMGGDIALALAGMDRRVSRVAGVASSPDWYREGMADVMDPGKIIAQGEPSVFSQWLCDMLNPASNLESFHRDLSVRLEYGKRDTHILSSWGHEFKGKLETRRAESTVSIVETEDATHISLIQKKAVLIRAVSFLSEPLSPG